MFYTKCLRPSGMVGFFSVIAFLVDGLKKYFGFGYLNQYITCLVSTGSIR